MNSSQLQNQVYGTLQAHTLASLAARTKTSDLLTKHAQYFDLTKARLHDMLWGNPELSDGLALAKIRVGEDLHATCSELLLMRP